MAFALALASRRLVQWSGLKNGPAKPGIGQGSAFGENGLSVNVFARKSHKNKNMSIFVSYGTGLANQVLKT